MYDISDAPRSICRIALTLRVWQAHETLHGSFSFATFSLSPQSIDFTTHWRTTIISYRTPAISTFTTFFRQLFMQIPVRILRHTAFSFFSGLSKPTDIFFLFFYAIREWTFDMTNAKNENVRLNMLPSMSRRIRMRSMSMLCVVPSFYFLPSVFFCQFSSFNL